MESQPEALRLADALDRTGETNEPHGAAAELRRLHEANQKLLEALETFAECELNDNNCASLGVATMRIRAVARAAIANANGELK